MKQLTHAESGSEGEGEGEHKDNLLILVTLVALVILVFLVKLVMIPAIGPQTALFFVVSVFIPTTLCLWVTFSSPLSRGS